MPTPAKSARLQLVEGNPAKKNVEQLKRRAEQEEKMKMSAEHVIPPAWLNQKAKKEFERLAKLLLEVELINDADVTHLALYCDAYSQYLSFKRQVKAKGMWIDGKPNPFFIRMKDAASQMRSLGSDLGLSPAARARLAINLESDDGEEDDF
ncbi:P27 family predicted phage terminase small subunit [Pullulanibacillus pueri]|uniref:Terminase n=1 Tax=Pullulanibacillus pueri TaxID=1437324 RepID=A0A8J2ZWI7_9BACL|nr:phage terminase small subunit P27 family [Pullulanibacillus pueri]MBM7681957.1 P27 family predicted phage terminase small subunit [Pullulanibacillus pueri]GGH83590.1 terminase [Pullulanibacillus pueri]